MECDVGLWMAWALNDSHHLLTCMYIATVSVKCTDIHRYEILLHIGLVHSFVRLGTRIGMPKLCDDL